MTRTILVLVLGIALGAGTAEAEPSENLDNGVQLVSLDFDNAYLSDLMVGSIGRCNIFCFSS